MHYLIDGHNLIGQMPGISLADPDDEQKLIAALRAFLVRVNKQGVVIFDKGLPGGAGKWSNAVLEVRFAQGGKSADDLILARVKADRNPGGLIVVSGDNEIMAAAKQAGARAMRASDFAAKMQDKPKAARKKEDGLSPDEVAFWEEAFKKKR